MDLRSWAIALGEMHTARMRVWVDGGLLRSLAGYSDIQTEIGLMLVITRAPNFSWAAPCYQHGAEVLDYRFRGNAYGAHACL